MRWTRALTRAEWLRLAGFGGVVALLHLLGWGLFIYYSRRHPVAAGKLGLDGGFWSFMHSLDFGHIGYGIAGLFIVTWAGAAVVWKVAHLDQRWNDLLE